MQSTQVHPTTAEASLSKREIGYHTKQTTSREEVLERRCCVGDYHVYKDMWKTAVGEMLICEREPDNASDRS